MKQKFHIDYRKQSEFQLYSPREKRSEKCHLNLALSIFLLGVSNKKHILVLIFIMFLIKAVPIFSEGGVIFTFGSKATMLIISFLKQS